MPSGIPRFPVLPIIAATVAMEYSFWLAKSFLATRAEMIKIKTTMTK